MAQRNIKYTIEDVRETFENVGYKLLSTEYVNCKTKLQYMCLNKHIREMSFDNLKNSKKKCPACQKNEKHTYDYVSKCFKERGYNLLDKEYKNNSQKLNYICNNGHTTSISFHKFQQGKGCGKCLGRNVYTLQDIIQYFHEYGCKLLTLEYINMSQKIEYICACGEQNETTFTAFKVGGKCCKECYADKTRHDIEDVKKLFADNGCTLLETKYINNHTNMRYVCNCGEESDITYTNFRRGQRCYKCGRKKVEETCLINYGFSHAVQSPIVQEIMEKPGKNWKEYTMPSGKIVKIQGYEGLGIDDLLNLDIAEDDIDIHCKSINKEFLYYHNGLYRCYLPDIYIPSTNTIVEIKSEYIYMKEKLQNLQKAKCCIALGYEFEFWIYDEKKKKRIVRYDNRFNIVLMTI
jgi:hypothetical protein